jgi:tripartite ATP-independent transporter DctP family solute receptor
MKRKAFAVAIIMLVAITTIVAQGKGESVGENKVVTLRVAENQTAESHLAKAMIKFSELVQEKSNGDMVIEVYLNAELGEEAETIEQVDAGVLEIARVDAVNLTQYVPELEVFTLPYIFNDDNHKWNVFNGEVGKEINGKLQEAGFVNLGFLESGWRSFYSKNELKGIQSLKGKKIRVQDSQVYIKMMELFGAKATPMSFAEVFTSLQTGVIDAAENDPVSYVSAGHYEAAKYYLMDNHSADISLFVMSKKIFDGLSKDQQQIILESAAEAVEWEKGFAVNLQKEARLKAEASGCTFIEANIAEFQSAVAPIYDMYPQYSSIIQKIRATK